MPDGRWVNPHNARIDYHFIMLAALLRLDAVVNDDRLTAVVDAALSRAKNEVIELGAAGVEDGIDALLLARSAGLTVGDALAIEVNDAYRNGDVQNGALALWLRSELP
jgi:hypothetical protein